MSYGHNIAGPTTQSVVRRRVGRADDTIAGPTKARMRFGGTKIAGRQPEEVSVGLVRRRETPHGLKDQRRTDIRGISKAVAGRAVGQDCRRARRRHTEVRSSYHFRQFLFRLPPFCMAFVDTNYYVVLHFKKVNGSIPATPIDGWWLRKSSSRNKNLWLQSLENDLKLFQKLMPPSSGGAVINLD
ncbi:hypothetical protein BY996DRAFT_6553391 [Phakopsora pachyrhizi]|nr:hypothetical protein BY996DRAFT_6553391 [Phakopsora pachyrhizi]